MGMDFKLNIRLGFRVQPRFLPSPPSLISSSPVRGRDASFNSARLSSSSAICEETESFGKDTMKACICSATMSLGTSNDLSEMEETKINTKERSAYPFRCVSNGAERPIRTEQLTSHSSIIAGKVYFSMLMKNLDVLEETFADRDVINLERDILLQLGRLGALNLFNACLSLKTSTFLDLSEVTTENIEDQKTSDETKLLVDSPIVHSGRRKRRKSRRGETTDKAEQFLSLSKPSKAIRNNFRKPAAGRTSNDRKRLIIARNEAEMSRGVKVLAELERIRETFERESGKVPSLSCWAEAAGIEEKELQQNLYFGLFCRDEIIRSSRPLVLFLARNYRRSGLSLDDLIQAGSLGVLEGAKRFDQTRGYRFSTYVQYWVRKSMSRMVDCHSRGIRVPLSLSRAINQIQKARKMFHQTNTRSVEDSDIARVTGLSLAKISAAGSCLRVVGSVDQKMGDSLNARFMEYEADLSIQSPEESVMRKQMRKDIYDLLHGLDLRERQVLSLRYGLLDDYRPKSLAEIGKLLLVSKEWVRKLERRALTKITNEQTVGNLTSYSGFVVGN